MVVHQEACPMWVPIVENNEIESDASDIFIRKNLENLLSKDKNIDTIILGCTHYPLLMTKIKQHLPDTIKLVSQGEIVAESLVEYLKRHDELEQKCTKGGSIDFFTTDSSENFDSAASMFYGKPVKSSHLEL